MKENEREKESEKNNNEKYIALKVDGKEVKYPEGTLWGDVAEDFKAEYSHDIILARKNSRLIELGKHIKEGGEVSFLDTSSVSGHSTYVRGVILLMLKSFYDNYKDKVKDIFVRYTIGDSIFCDVEGLDVTPEIIADVEEGMRKLVSLDLPIEKDSVSTDKAMRDFGSHGMAEKEKLFNYRMVSRVNIYKLAGFEDYYYGYMPKSTGVLKYFSLEVYEKGFVINLPNRKTPEKVSPFVPRVKLFNTLREATRWGKLMEVSTIGDLNECIAKGQINDLILVQEALQERKIAEIASRIAQSDTTKFVMIAGPSSSGKTSFANRLSIQLRTLGLKPHPISVDNYFKEREDTPRDENGNYDFECLEAIDTELFNSQMVSLLNGETVSLPTFDFVDGKKLYKGDFLSMGPDDILVIEGIHGLNDKLSFSLPKESKFKIYISALTQINVDEHNRISTTDGRLIRRMVRDARTRGTSAAETIDRWPSVRRGEDHFIFPFQEDADVMFNSALIYELAVLKCPAEQILFSIDRNSKEYVEAKRLLKFLDYCIGVSPDYIPKNSLMREFVGGSVFNV